MISEDIRLGAILRVDCNLLSQFFKGNVVDRRSTWGCWIYIGGKLVIRRSKQQNVVAKTLANGICYVLWTMVKRIS